MFSSLYHKKNYVILLLFKLSNDGQIVTENYLLLLSQKI